MTSNSGPPTRNPTWKSIWTTAITRANGSIATQREKAVPTLGNQILKLEPQRQFSKACYNFQQETLPRTTGQRCKNVITLLNTHSQLCSVHKNSIFKPQYLYVHVHTHAISRLLSLENYQTEILQLFILAQLFHHHHNTNSSSCDKSISHGLAATYIKDNCSVHKNSENNIFIIYI